jgi:hypothetical protein
MVKTILKKKVSKIKVEAENKKEDKAEKGIEEAGEKKKKDFSLKAGHTNVMNGKCPDCGKNAATCNC